MRALAAHVADLYARRPFRDFVFSVESANDRLRYYTVSGKPDFDDDGAFRGYKGTSSNVTEREELNQLKQDFSQQSVTNCERRLPP